MKLNRPAFFVVLVALLFRMAVLGGLYFQHGPEIFYAPDTRTYIGPGERLWSHGEFTSQLSDGSRYWETMRTPVYPALIGFAKRMAGGHWELAVVAFQLMLDSALAGLVFAVGRMIGGDRVGVVAGVLQALSLTSAFYATKLLTETIFAVLTFAGFALTLWFPRSRAAGGRSLGVGAAAGSLLALAALTRPLGYYVFALYLVVALLVTALWGREGSHWHRLRPWVVCLLVYLGTANLWVGRNGIRTGYWSVASIDYVNLLFYRAGPVEARVTGKSLGEIYNRYRERYDLAEAPTWDQSPAGLAKGKTMKRDASATIAAHPLIYAMVAGRGMLNTMFGPNRTDLDNLLGPRLGLATSCGVIVLLAVLWALFLAGAVTNHALWPATLLLGALLVVSSGAESYARFRVVLEPLLALGAASAMNWSSGRIPGTVSKATVQSKNINTRKSSFNIT